MVVSDGKGIKEGDKERKMYLHICQCSSLFYTSADDYKKFRSNAKKKKK
jgi:hypothetical protein